MVQKAVVEVEGEWLLDPTNRYSYHTKLIPLTLSSQIDVVEETITEDTELWDDGSRLSFFLLLPPFNFKVPKRK